MARIFGADLHSYRDHGDESTPQISVPVFLFCMIVASLSVISMIVVACGQHLDRADSTGRNNVVYYGSDSRNPNAKGSGGGGGDGGGDGGGCGGGCGGCSGGCGG